MEQNKLSEKKKLKKETSRSLIIALVIIASAFLPYIHDLIPRGVSYPGYSGLRPFLYIVFINLFGLIGWTLFLMKSKKELYRFVILVPVSLVTYQLIVYILNLKKTSFNDVNIKLAITFLLTLVVTIVYFKNKLKKYE